MQFPGPARVRAAALLLAAAVAASLTALAAATATPAWSAAAPTATATDRVEADGSLALGTPGAVLVSVWNPTGETWWAFAQVENDRGGALIPLRARPPA